MKITCNRASAALATHSAGPHRRRRPLLHDLLYGLGLPMLALPTAMAADSAQLNVAGRIIPAPCIVSLANNGSADFGVIPTAMLGGEGMRKEVARRTVPFTIYCAPVNRPKLSFRDNRKHTVPDIYNTVSNEEGRSRMFGLGRVGDMNIGMYLLHLSTLKADGNRAELVRSENGESDWKMVTPQEVITKGHKYVWSTTGRPESGTFSTITGDIVVILWPESIQNLPLQSEIRLDGNTTLDLEYL